MAPLVAPFAFGTSFGWMVVLGAWFACAGGPFCNGAWPETINTHVLTARISNPARRYESIRTSQVQLMDERFKGKVANRKRHIRLELSETGRLMRSGKEAKKRRSVRAPAGPSAAFNRSAASAHLKMTIVLSATSIVSADKYP
jgi:hypothetical protein